MGKNEECLYVSDEELEEMEAAKNERFHISPFEVGDDYSGVEAQ